MAALIVRSNSPFVLAMGRFKRHKLAMASFALLVLMIVIVIFAPLFAQMMGVDGNQVDLFNQKAAPSEEHLLGTDELGRDVMVRLMYGGRISLFIGLIAAIAAATVGTVIGLFAGYFGGRLDALLMRFTDSVIALPLLPLLIVLAAIDLRKLGFSEEIASSDMVSFYRIIVIVALVGWTTVARLVRGATLSLKEREFVMAAEGVGASHMRIMFKHIFPNLISPIIVAVTLSVGNVILLESVLSFLGLGIQPPMPSWGNMLTNAQELIWDAPMLAVYPGLLIFVTVISFNFLGDGLQDAFDPKAEV
ncbi:ABC transporter permease [Paraglaciecola sp. L3A3]|uniref:ABC transporter permease n=1 Tax=Paraglaciecola sp. L3A3 TaxID=2686358 RepID=UPI00131D9B70|nr:ABC transporter permease [Paraglaciecola sp. L3A3]